MQNLKTVDFGVAFTLTRPAPADYEDKDGNTQTAAANEPRFNYSNGVAQGLVLDASLSETAAIDDVPAFNVSAGHWIIDAEFYNSEPLKGMGLNEVFRGSGKMVVSYSGGTAKVWAGGQAIYTVASYTPAEPTHICEGGMVTMAGLTYKPSAISDADAAALATGEFSAGAYTPLTLFSEGQQGAWYDPSDLTTLFQDSAGTTPVTADGDPVGLMLDKSGNSNRASQSTTAAKPTREAPGISPDTSDYMGVGQSLNHEAFTVCVAVLMGPADQRIIDNRGTGSAGTVPGWHIKSGGVSDCAIVDDGAGHTWQWPFPASVPAGTPRILTLRYAPNSGLFRIDGQPIPPGNTSNSMGSILSPVDGNLFTASNSIGTQNFTGKFLGGIVVSEAVSDQDVDRIERYLSSITGVPLP